MVWSDLLEYEEKSNYAQNEGKGSFFMPKMGSYELSMNLLNLMNLFFRFFCNYFWWQALKNRQKWLLDLAEKFIRKRKKITRLYSLVCFCCHYEIINNKDILLNYQNVLLIGYGISVTFFLPLYIFRER